MSECPKSTKENIEAQCLPPGMISSRKLSENVLILFQQSAQHCTELFKNISYSWYLEKLEASFGMIIKHEKSIDKN